MSVLNFNFFMISIMLALLALLKNHLNFLKESIFEFIFKKYNKRLFFKKVWVFFHNI